MTLSGEVAPEGNGTLVQFGPETARSLLSALSLPRNNHIELFKKQVQVSLGDLEALTRKVNEKLQQLKIDQSSVVMKAVVSLDKDRSFQLIGWKRIACFDWGISGRTRAISVVWNFLYQPEGVAEPELHSLSVRITEAPHPMHFLRAALASDPDEVERVALKSAPVVCEVEYVDRLLCRELIDLVSSWHSALRRPAPLLGIGGTIQIWQEKICYCVDVSLEFAIPISYMAASYLFLFKRRSDGVDVDLVMFVMLALMGFSLVVKIANRFSTFVAKSIASRIDRMGRFPVFELTSGDQNNLTAAISKISRSTIEFWLNIALAFAINIASTVFTVCVLGID